MVSTAPMNYQLEFCYPYTYADFIRAVKRKDTASRVMFIGIEHLRMFLNLTKGKPFLEPYQRQGGCWGIYPKPLTIPELDVKKMCHSAGEFEEELVRVFFRAFPHAEEAFLERMPKHGLLVKQLEAEPTKEFLERERLLYSLDTSIGVDDADGCVSIVCEDGSLDVPFDGDSNDFTMQMYRAKFHPDIVVVSAFNDFFDWLDSVKSRISSITLVSLLNRLDGLVK